MTDAAEHNGNAYLSTSQQRLLRVLNHLAERPLQSFSVNVLAEGLGEPYNAIFRDLRNLEFSGWVISRDGAWGIAPRLTRLAERLRLDIAELHHTYLGEVENG